MKASYLNSFNCEQHNRKIYFAGADFNIVYTYDIEDESFGYIVPTNENMTGAALYGNVVFSNNHLYLIPLSANSIWKLSEDGCTWTEIVCKGDRKALKFYGAIPGCDYIYMLGYGDAEIKKLDTKSDEIIDVKIRGNKEFRMLDQIGFLSPSYILKNGKYYIPMMCDSALLEIDINEDFAGIIEIDSRVKGFAAITFDGEYFWLPPRHGNYFVRLDQEFHVTEFALPSVYKEDAMIFGGVYLDKDYVVFTSYNAENFVFNRNDITDFMITKPSIYYSKEFQDGGLVVHHRNLDTIYIDIDGSKKILDAEAMLRIRDEYFYKYILKQSVVSESHIFCFNDFLKEIVLPR